MLQIIRSKMRTATVSVDLKLLARPWPTPTVVSSGCVARAQYHIIEKTGKKDVHTLCGQIVKFLLFYL
jgi:hypothetical protein